MFFYSFLGPYINSCGAMPGMPAMQVQSGLFRARLGRR